jgi:hypothetical protein
MSHSFVARESGPAATPVRILGAAFAVALLVATPAAAQISISVSPQVTWLSPNGRYDSAVRLPGPSVSFDLPNLGMVGGSVGIVRAGWPVELRVSGITTTHRRAAVAAFECDSATLCTADDPFTAHVGFRTVTGDLLLTPLPNAAFRPYVLAGAGAARYSFYWPRRPAEDLALTIPDQEVRTFVTRAGAGLAGSLGRFTANVEAADLMTWFDEPGTTEHALALTLGLGLRIR